MRFLQKDFLFNFLMLHKWPYWLSAVVVGLTAIGYSKLVKIAEELSHSLYSKNHYLMLVISPLLFFLSWLIVRYFAPEAKGSGIPQVMAAVEKLKSKEDDSTISHLLSFKIVVIKILSSLLCLIGGGAIGREGPSIQISASIFYISSTKFNFFKKYINSETWIVTGAAAGLAAAFNTPLGGLVYAIEELATLHINKFKTTLITAVLIAGFSAQMISGPYLYLGIPQVSPLKINFIPYVILISIISGSAGSIFGVMLFKLTQYKNKLFQSNFSQAIIAMICGLLIATIALVFDDSILGSGKEIIVQLLFTNKETTFWEPILRFFGPIITYLSGCAGGIFAPSLAVGASIGKQFSTLFNLETNIYVLLGMIGFLTGVTKAPFTSLILVLEMTDRHSAIFPMMITALISMSFSHLFSHESFYEKMKKTYLPQSTETQKSS